MYKLSVNHSAATVWLYMLEEGTQIFQREKHFGKGKNYISVHNGVIIINIFINSNSFIITVLLQGQ